MAWVVDTCLILDIAGADPTFATASAQCLSSKASDGIILCPISYVELAPMWRGNASAQNEALAGMGVFNAEPWTVIDTQVAHSAWHRHVAAKRTGHSAKRPIADILIGAFASRFQGLLTRNPSDFRASFPNLPIVTP